MTEDLQSIIDNIEKDLNRNKLDLVSILHKVIQIATNLNHQDVVNWAKMELTGYHNQNLIPSYRTITCWKQKIYPNESRGYDVIGEINFEKGLREILNSVRNKISYFYRNAFISKYEYRINKNSFLQIIEGIKVRIREYITKVNLYITQKKKIDFQKRLNEIENLIDSNNLSLYLKNEKEKGIFRQNLISLLQFAFSGNFKYCMIAMGSILEFLLKRYFKVKKIATGDRFVDNVKEAIDNNIFDDKERWKLVQDYLRNFRNYVHIEKEIKSTIIDDSWYEIMLPTFEALFKKFIENP